MEVKLAHDEYKCECCGLVWGFCPEDYDEDKQPYPTRCPFCWADLLFVIKDLLGQHEFAMLSRVLVSRLIWKLMKC